jgi:hypothetical protein
VGVLLQPGLTGEKEIEGPRIPKNKFLKKKCLPWPEIHRFGSIFIII